MLYGERASLIVDAPTSSAHPGPMIVNSSPEVIKMNIPGFTAEASVSNVGTRYQAVAEARFYGGIVQPAGPFSDVVSDPYGSSFPHIFPPGWGNCLKRECVHRYLGVCTEYRWVIAIC